jgi:CHRD domain
MRLSILAATAALLVSATAAQAGLLTFRADFVPEGGGCRSGSGSVTVEFDELTNDLHFFGSFSGLSAPNVAAHFHCCTASPFTGNAGIAVDTPSLPGFPLGVTAGSFDTTLDLDDPLNFTPAFLGAGTAQQATARLIQGFLDNKGYLNIHTTAFPGGEIRAVLDMPEPGSAALAVLALLTVGGVARKRVG